MRQTACLVSVRMEGITRKVGAIATEGHALFLGAGINAAFRWNDGTLTFYLTASWTVDVFLRYVELLCDQSPQFLILVCQVSNAVETRQATGRGHFLIVHSLFFHERVDLISPCRGKR